MNGSFVYENWLAARMGAPRLAGAEVPIFTDAWITGEIDKGMGPYQLLNMIGMTARVRHAPAVTLRYWIHLEHETPEMEKTNVERYHGGDLSDEIAALASLCMGVRLQAGGRTRQFDGFVKDPLGRPFSFEAEKDPGRPIVSARPLLPRCGGQHNLNRGCSLLSRYPDLPPQAANVLVRAARNYQEGVWISDSAPEMTWLLLVSAIETVASFWRSANADTVERMALSRPELYELLKKKGDNDWVRSVADLIAPYMGATKAFVDFILEHLPDPPCPRQAAHHSWDRKQLRDSLRTIYKWRSRALHGGTPFPSPMCEPPMQLGNILTERPLGLAAASSGGIWIAEDTPMLLHLFEHLVRGAILKWWDSLAMNERDSQPFADAKPPESSLSQQDPSSASS